MNKIKDLLQRITRYFNHDIWKIRLSERSLLSSFFIRLIKILLLTARGFGEDKFTLRASSLTFYTLLSVVPVVAMAFGIAKGFGFEKMFSAQLLEKFPGQEEVMLQIISFAHSMLENTKGGMVAGIGIVVLFWSIIKVLGQIENSFNAIWKVEKARLIGRKLSDYLSIMLICPVLIIMSGSITVFIRSQVTMITSKVTMLELASPLISMGLKMLPYGLIWLLFTFLYLLMPNTRVKFSSGFVGGVIAGTLYQLAQGLYLYFQIGVSRYNAIYGSFAALPLFLIWLQISWFIVLIGAEISHAHQNSDLFEFNNESDRISLSLKRVLSLQTAHLIIKRFCSGTPPLTAAEISATLQMPLSLVDHILDALVESGTFCFTSIPDGKEPACQPAQDTNFFTVHYILNAMENSGYDNISMSRSDTFQNLSEVMKRFNETLSNSPANRLLKEI
jgi:membrane protein